MTAKTELTQEELERYARHLTLPSFGIEAQRRLKDSGVLCIGAGGLGSPAAMYLAAAGVGRIGIVDPDTVDASNIQRQLLHGTSDINRPKVESAKDALTAINPNVQLELHRETFAPDNAMEITRQYDVLIDGSDNFPTRYLSNDVSVLLKIPNVHGSIFRFEGQVSVFAPHLDAPCYRCLFPDAPNPGAVPD
jgi:adenylyltransferase/sulfurtransferase